MARLLIFIGGGLLGWIGWWLGSMIGPAAAFIFSGLGTMTGIYLGWRIHRDVFY